MIRKKVNLLGNRKSSQSLTIKVVCLISRAPLSNLQKTLGEMVGDDSKLENQKISRKGKITQTRDMFMLPINGEAVDGNAGFKITKISCGTIRL